MRRTLAPALLLAALPLATACDRAADELSDTSTVSHASFFPEHEPLHAAPLPPVVVDEPPPPPPTPRELAPPIIRGIYVNAYAAGSPEHRARLLALADSTEINTFVVDVKDDDGIRYVSGLPLAQEVSRGTIPLKDLAALVDTLEAHGIYPIARVVVFKDSRLAEARPEWAIRTPSGGLWTDKAGNRWMSPWDERVWDHVLGVAEEAARAGFREVQFDYVRFPEPYRSLPRQVHARGGERKADAIAGFLAEARRRLHPLGVTVAADVFGVSTSDAKDVGIGQQWETLSVVADHLLPMVYPSHYFPTHLPGVRRPNRMPYETVFTSVGMAVLRNRKLREEGAVPARVIPWVQAFTANWVDRDYPYGPEQARAQMQALYDLGLEDWVFWNAASKYDAVAPAFAREAEPRANEFHAPESLARWFERVDGWGAAKARERAVGGSD